MKHIALSVNQSVAVTSRGNKVSPLFNLINSGYVSSHFLVQTGKFC